MRGTNESSAGIRNYVAFRPGLSGSEGGERRGPRDSLVTACRRQSVPGGDFGGGLPTSMSQAPWSGSGVVGLPGNTTGATPVKEIGISGV